MVKPGEDLKETLITAMDRYNAALQAWSEAVKNGRLDRSTQEEVRDAEDAYAAAARAWDEACEKKGEEENPEDGRR